jgi:hypothetical protein
MSNRFYAVESQPDPVHVVGEIVAPEIWLAEAEPEQERRQVARDTILWGNPYPALLTREELDSTLEGRLALQAWEAGDDSVYLGWCPTGD